jgi:hypothetical protein
MMKKLLVLSLVMAVASFATAALDLGTIEGISYEVDAVNGIVTISGVNVFGFEFGVLKPDAGALTPGALGAFSAGGAGIGAEAMGLDSVYGAGAIVGAAGGMTTGSGLTGVLYSFSFSPEVLLITIGPETEYQLGAAYVQVGQTTYDLTGYTIVPEPMTMGLLSLGALFLRRRK